MSLYPAPLPEQLLNAVLVSTRTANQSTPSLLRRGFTAMANSCIRLLTMYPSSALPYLPPRF